MPTTAPDSPPSPVVALDEALCRHPAPSGRYLVAYSGGPDSTLLLSLIAARIARRRLRVIHVHHGWHTDADAWAEHCRGFARALGLRCEVVRVDAAPKEGEGPEAAARNARHAALRARMKPGDMLLTAHHADDQAETLLLGLLRGGGLRGLAAMPEWRRFGPGEHLRPWLNVAREAIEAEVGERGLATIRDPANTDPAYDRVFLRTRVLPLLRERWPAVDSVLARAASRAGESAGLLDDLAAVDFVACRGSVEQTLDCSALLALSAARQRNLVRWWLRRNGLSTPPATRLETLLEQVAMAGKDRVPLVEWPGAAVRRWSGLLWAVPERPPIEAGARFSWSDRSRPLELPDRTVTGEDLSVAGIDIPPDAEVVIAYREGGERILHEGRLRALKEVLREAGVPPWERDRMPLVYVDGELAGVIGLPPAT